MSSPQRDDSPLTPFRLAHLVELYARAVEARGPADRSARDYCAERPYLGSHDRAFLLDAFFDLLRRRARLCLLWAWVFQGASSPETPDQRLFRRCFRAPGEEAVAAAALFLLEQHGLDLGAAAARLREAVARVAGAQARRKGKAAPLIGLPDGLTSFLAAVAREPDPADAPPLLRRAMRLSILPDLLERWTAQWGALPADALAAALGQPAPVDVRVNVARCAVDACRAELESAGTSCELAPLSPHGLRLARRANVQATPAWREGRLEVMDAASQLVALALAPLAGWRVFDACAGAGGKALHLAALLHGAGEVYAHDVQTQRMEPLRKRAQRAGAENVFLVGPELRCAFSAARPSPAVAPPEAFDAVLIDAPCSGLGTLRRSPHLGWRPLRDLAGFARQQRECLERYAPRVRPGGVLVYATCSVDRGENEEVVEGFLHAHGDFSPDALAPALDRMGAGEAAQRAEGHILRTWPQRDGTDGFFIARLVRRR